MLTEDEARVAEDEKLAACIEYGDAEKCWRDLRHDAKRAGERAWVAKNDMFLAKNEARVAEHKARVAENMVRYAEARAQYFKDASD